MNNNYIKSLKKCNTLHKIYENKDIKILERLFIIKSLKNEGRYNIIIIVIFIGRSETVREKQALLSSHERL